MQLTKDKKAFIAQNNAFQKEETSQLKPSKYKAQDFTLKIPRINIKIN